MVLPPFPRQEVSMKPRAVHDVFLSYAGEDSDLAREIAGALHSRSIKVWYAETELKVGDSLLESIDRGLRESERGILVLSDDYLAKGWPRYELDILMRQHIESDKRLLPVWHGVSKADVEASHPGLAGIYALSTSSGFEALVKGLQQVIVPNAATLAQTSIWEDPLHRFLNGEGEATVLEGGTFTLWEALLNFGPEDFPLRINDNTFTREDLVTHAVMALYGDLSDRQMKWLRSIGYK
jgi:hypothetical protein